ncbi:MAG: protein arginine kinase [Clostridia bacterium]|nr:protein arginine kinase [Clostridia bacterium]
MTNDNIVVTSRVRLARNVAHVPFPARLKDERAFSVVMKGAESTAKALFEYDFYRISTLSDVDKNTLVERHMISSDLTVNNTNGAIIISKDETVSVMINEEDHYRIQSIVSGYDLDTAYRKAIEYEDTLSKNVDIAYDNKLGYLTACPTNLGTGMRASVMMFLPALTMTNNIAKLVKTVQRMGLTVRGVFGEGSDTKGYMYQLSNEITLGLSEEDILKRLADIVNTTIKAEIQAREALLGADRDGITDRVWRAKGTLTNAYRLSSDECMELIALVKMGAQMGVIEADISTLDKLSVMCQPASLTKVKGQPMTPEERDKYRAEYIRQNLK